MVSSSTEIAMTESPAANTLPIGGLIEIVPSALR